MNKECGSVARYGERIMIVIGGPSPKTNGNGNDAKGEKLWRSCEMRYAYERKERKIQKRDLAVMRSGATQRLKGSWCVLCKRQRSVSDFGLNKFTQKNIYEKGDNHRQRAYRGVYFFFTELINIYSINKSKIQKS